MPERVSPAVRVRPVRGRTVDPFRGVPSDDADRLASRSVDAQPIDDVAAALERVPGAKVTRAGRRFTIGRGHDVIRVAFASAARRVSLDDATFEGDGNLVITVLHALLPLFGAVEVRVAGGYADVIDGHEPLAVVLERYDAWWIEESLKLAKQMEARDAARAQAAASPSHAPVQPFAVRRTTRRQRIAFAAVVSVLIGSLVVGTWMAQKRDVGESCTAGDQCDSRQCLPREPIQRSTYNGIELDSAPPAPRDPSGVCTKRCDFDSDCPADMRCGDVMSYGRIGLGTRSTRCIPRAW